MNSDKRSFAPLKRFISVHLWLTKLLQEFYYQKVQAQLDAAPESVFTPSLDILDKLIESITVIEP